ncbi:hypothetical protein [Arsenophonus sp.]|uniref:hypothetical protein n=1 Tax=Arsenophonus sp. TaxID=1872640 RepID=UPI00387928CC
MKQLGAFLFVIGVVAIIISFNLDVSVETSYGNRINNIGLMSERQNYLIISCLVAACGFILILFSNVNKGLFSNENLDKVDCPFCAEEININAIICKHCKSNVDNELANMKPKKTKKSFYERYPFLFDQGESHKSVTNFNQSNLNEKEFHKNERNNEIIDKKIE